MSLIRRIILALVLTAGLTPALAQVPPPVPALPDTPRIQPYTIAASTCACAVNFALYGDGTDYQNWVEVWLNGTQVQYNDPNFGWTITSPTGSLATIPRPITDAVLTFNLPQTGTVQIVGARRPRRVSQFTEGRGVAARDLNQALTDIIAQNRETWDKTNDVSGRAILAPPGETMLPLPPAATRASQALCFDINGNPIPCLSFPTSTLTAGSGIGLSGANPTTISVASNSAAGAINALCTVGPSICVKLFGYANPLWYGADATGVNASDAAINSAVAASQSVYATQGTYRLSAAIQMKPNTHFTCQAGATITQGNGANLAAFFDFFTNVATGAQLDHCTVNGNGANNTSINTNLVNINNNANNISLTYNTFTGSSGGDVVIANSAYDTVVHNYMSNSIAYGVAIINSSSGSRGYHQINHNVMIGPMLHLIQVTQVDANDLSDNVLIQGAALGGANSSMVVSISGTTATWVSGTNFAGVTLGDVLVVNGGQEFPIAAVVSNTQLTLSTSGSLSSVPAAIGGGDVLSITNTSFNRAFRNHITGGVTGGIVLSQGGGSIPSTESAIGNIISGNFIDSSGNFGIALESFTASGSPIVGQTIITGNFVISPGRSGAAGSAPGGIQLSANSGLMPGVIVDDNYLYDPFALANGYCITGSGSANATTLSLGKNICLGFSHGSVLSGYPTFASLPTLIGYTGYIVDGLAGSCGDGSCTTFGTAVSGGGGALIISVRNNGAGWTLTGK